MGCIRPATPGFIVTLVATILLAVVSFCVPYFKSVYFLKASVKFGDNTGSITFGTLGYCVDLPGNSTCSSPSVGYELDINGLVGNKLPFEIPNVLVKWLTYALVLHIVALALSAGSAVFGLLAHVREMSMTCCSTCVSGFAAVVAMVAFIFDIALFFITKSRINSVPGGSAEIGNAIWLTLAAWLLLFFSGCFYTLGRCCVTKRSRSKNDWNNKGNDDREQGRMGGFFNTNKDNSYEERMRLDAVKAEADRKARQKTATEGGLPAFYEIQPLTAQESQPLTARVEGDSVYVDTPYRDEHNGHPGRQASAGGSGGYVGGGYARAPAGTRAVDEYYNPTNTSYPPQPQHQPAPSQRTPRRQPSASTYSAYSYQGSQAPSTSPPPMPIIAPPPQRTPHTSPPPNNQYLNAGNQYGQDRSGYSNAGYGHAARDTSYQSAVSHQQYPSNYSQAQDHFNPDTYNATAMMTSPPPNIAANPYLGGNVTSSPIAEEPTSYYNPHSPTPPIQHPTPDRSYTLGGDGYGQNTVPALNDQYGSSYNYAYGGHSTGSPAHTPSPAVAALNTAVAAAAMPHSGSTSPVRGPRAQPSIAQAQYDDAPPGYDAGPSAPTGQWGKN
ncbi:hypothetical protein PLEOSDRAFT_1063170 [Pleurotus ostreatus PC15]|uniref:Pali-domain-containing protein n=1 Tax=Pleurotus ostreatus (strain PC15) TaxID=1137138 RepID=A0A067P4D4_PLEO1|nr:hypothetical protein PLEOSDRAFT_1063170 [Pleurotus ostreatus PC15]